MSPLRPVMPWPSPGVRAVIVAIHGILTRTTSPSWPDHLDAFLTDCKVERRDYFAGPFPIFETFLWNRIRARELADEVCLLDPKMTVHFVGHSNGCDIALKTIKILASRGRHVYTMILTGSVSDPDVEKSGVMQLIESGALGRAYAYCGDRDLPLALPLKWPYKDLGRRGWMRANEPYEELRIRTRMFAGYGHGDYFVPRNRRATFTMMRADMCL